MYDIDRTHNLDSRDIKDNSIEYKEPTLTPVQKQQEAPIEASIAENEES
jgi:hypothetical protein